MKLRQLSLRDLLLLMALAAVSCGWWVDRMRLNQLVDTHRKESQWLQRSLANLGWVISKDDFSPGRAPLAPPKDFQIPPLSLDERNQ